MKKYDELQYAAVVESSGLDISKCPKCEFIAVADEKGLLFYSIVRNATTDLAGNVEMTIIQTLDVIKLNRRKKRVVERKLKRP